MSEKNIKSVELEFVVFCIENLAKEFNINAEKVYKALKESNIIDEYIVPEYESLHTQSKEYIVNDIIDVMTLEYLKDSYVLHQTIAKGRDVANAFLNMMLAGKLPTTLNYTKIIDIWWKNLEISGVSYKVPSKIFEMIIATIYRNSHNTKERYGQYYGKQTNPSGYDYTTGNVRDVVKDLSTFSGMVFEDIGTMISNGINNSIDNIDEPISPLEKIIHY